MKVNSSVRQQVLPLLSSSHTVNDILFVQLPDLFVFAYQCIIIIMSVGNTKIYILTKMSLHAVLFCFLNSLIEEEKDWLRKAAKQLLSSLTFRCWLCAYVQLRVKVVWPQFTLYSQSSGLKNTFLFMNCHSVFLWLNNIILTTVFISHQYKNKYNLIETHRCFNGFACVLS